PVTAATALVRPDASSPWAATTARTSGVSAVSAGSLMVLLQVAANVNRLLHAGNQAIVECMSRIHARVLQEMIHRDHLGYHGDVLARVERHGDERDIDTENG